ncbi:hypothetical protein UY286_13400 [Paenibacillus polymyxa]|uniref:hypothetical protein n=2 Tax=Paenibacillus polymyxa TaxID=1406 RepID=UPI002AB55DA9|nr:hypothetical protein [Paenibacillus polymyxa]MDY8118428.1 hypothetical protein [Paenibacillus polymyxa]
MGKTLCMEGGVSAYVNQISTIPMYHENIDARLKNYIVPVIALNFVTVIHERQMKKNAGDDKLLRQMIAAMDEGFRVVRGLTISANAGRASFTNPQTTGVDAPFYKNLS